MRPAALVSQPWRLRRVHPKNGNNLLDSSAVRYHDVLNAMRWTEPECGSARAARVGKILAGRKRPTERLGWDAAFDLAGNWRSSHGYPLQVMYMTLRGRARRIDKKALVAQRLKRMPSIIAKLKRFEAMQLAQMHDLGGCRAVVKSVREVDRLVRLYEQRPCKAAKFYRKYDYIAAPKADGYRSVHLVFRYNSLDEKRSRFNGRRIEIQIRSRQQHAWATAVETIDTFTGQAIKSGIGSQYWSRFFVLISSFIASMERRALVPGTPPNVSEWFGELETLIRKLKVNEVFRGLHAGLELLADVPRDFRYTILVLDSKKRFTEMLSFDNEREAATRYLEIEKEKAKNPAAQAVMVSVDSMRALRQAYPTYYLDTAWFMGIVDGFMRGRGTTHRPRPLRSLR